MLCLITLTFLSPVCHNLFIYFHCSIIVINFLCFHRKLSRDEYFEYLPPEGGCQTSRHSKYVCEHQMVHFELSRVTCMTTLHWQRLTCQMETGVVYFTSCYIIPWLDSSAHLARAHCSITKKLFHSWKLNYLGVRDISVSDMKL